MLKRFKIDGRMQEVFTLRETDERIVYVPVKSMHRVDYDRFKEMIGKKPPRVDLLDYMSKYKLSNGLNALVQYDSLIQVANVHNNSATRVKKTDEIIASFEHKSQTEDRSKVAEAQQAPQPVVQQAPELSTQPQVQVYRFTNKHNKLQEWSGQGRQPDFIKEYAEAGGDINDFLVTK